MQPSAVVDTVVKYHVFREFTTPIFLAHPQKTGGLWLGMLVVLIPYMLIDLTQHNQQNTHGNDMSS